MRFPGEPLSDERNWQELVLDHLGVRAEMVELGDELDALGATATESLRRLGVRWPANGYLHAPVLELARGGSLLTGVGGDEQLGTRGGRSVLLSRGRDRPRWSDLREVPLELRSRSVREAAWLRAAPPFPWLTPAGLDATYRELAPDEVAWPHRWDRSLHHWHASRAFAAVRGLLGLYAEPFDVRVVHPLLEPLAMAELARAGGATGFRSRTHAMRRLFGDLLPDRLLARGTKAGFNRVVFGPSVHAFARAWDGSGVDAALVDAEALRAAWLSDEPDFRSIMLLQQAWLSAQPSAVSS
jgi:asparagine synthase (glutamine-hydrolysing)